MEIRRVGVFLGAELTGVDLTKPLDAASVEAIRRAHAEHGVLVFPGQKISSEDHKRFGRHFGRLHVHPYHATGVTPDHANDKLTIGVGGDYWVEFSGRVSGDAETYTLRLYRNGAPEGTLLDEVTLDGATSQKVGFAGPVTLAAGDVLTVYGQAGTAVDLTLKHAQLALKRIG